MCGSLVKLFNKILNIIGTVWRKNICFNCNIVGGVEPRICISRKFVR